MAGPYVAEASSPDNDALLFGDATEGVETEVGAVRLEQIEGHDGALHMEIREDSKVYLASNILLAQLHLLAPI